MAKHRKKCRVCGKIKSIYLYPYGSDLNAKSLVCSVCKYAPLKRARELNPFSSIACTQNRRVALMGIPGEVKSDEWELICILFDFKCASCGCCKPLTMDHVIPLSRGGQHSITNIQPLCRKCNGQKHTKSTDHRKSINMEDSEIISKAMSLLGQRKSDRKRASGQANIAHASTFRTLKPCSCDRIPHKSWCPVYQREYIKARREKKIENSSP
jgi:5-methylcytosine-specific restriction endonuclease McrA